MKEGYYLNTTITPKVGDICIANQDFGGDIHKGDVLEISTVASGGYIHFAGKNSSWGTYSGLSLLSPEYTESTEKLRSSNYSYNASASAAVTLLRSLGELVDSSESKNTLLYSNNLKKWVVTITAWEDTIPQEHLEMMLKRRLSISNKLKKLPKKGYNYSHLLDDSIQVNYKSLDELKEARSMGIFNEHSAASSRKWQTIKSGMLKETNALYSTVTDIKINNAEEQKALKELGVIKSIGGETYPKFVQGGAVSTVNFTGSTISFEEFMQTVDENIYKKASKNLVVIVNNEKQFDAVADFLGISELVGDYEDSKPNYIGVYNGRIICSVGPLDGISSKDITIYENFNNGFDPDNTVVKVTDKKYHNLVAKTFNLGSTYQLPDMVISTMYETKGKCYIGRDGGATICTPDINKLLKSAKVMNVSELTQKTEGESKVVTLENVKIATKELNSTQLTIIEQLLKQSCEFSSISKSSMATYVTKIYSDVWEDTDYASDKTLVSYKEFIELLKERVALVKSLAKLPREGYEYKYDYSEPVYYKNQEQELEAVIMRAKSTNVLDPGEVGFGRACGDTYGSNRYKEHCDTLIENGEYIEWEQLRHRLLLETSELYTYEKPVVINTREEEAFLVAVGAKQMMTDTDYPKYGFTRGSTSTTHDSQNLIYFKDFVEDMQNQIKKHIGEPMPSAEYDLNNLVVKVTQKEHHDAVVKKFILSDRYSLENLTSHDYTSGPFYIGKYEDGKDVIFTQTFEAIPITLPVIDSSDFLDNPVPEPPKPVITWKNPRPNIINQKEVDVGRLVVIDGMKIPQEVTRTTAKFVYVKGEKKRFKKEDVYPLYLKAGRSLDIGDVFNTEDNKDFQVFTGSLAQGAVSDVYSLKQSTIHCDVFDDAVLLDGKTYDTMEDVIKEHKDAKIKETRVAASYTFKKIAEHYNIALEDIVPKDVAVMEQLKVALDHPLNAAAKEWAIIYGPSGTGKTSVSVAYAEAKGAEYVKQQGNAQLTVDDFLGYKSITTGEYFRSLLRDAVEFGKVFILDEIDACNPNTLLVLNGLKQEKFQFPDALIEVHPDFRLIATANTLEYNEQYNARSPMDKASLARFHKIKYEMEHHELSIRYGLDYIKRIETTKLKKLVAREVEREVIQMRIADEKGEANA